MKMLVEAGGLLSAGLKEAALHCRRDMVELLVKHGAKHEPYEGEASLVEQVKKLREQYKKVPFVSLEQRKNGSEHLTSRRFVPPASDWDAIIRMLGGRP